MTIELSAVRLLAPWFGASAGVWTNVIGVVLFGLALGYLGGARLSMRPDPERQLVRLLCAAAVAAAFLPAAAGPIARWFMPAGVPLHDAAELLVWGSLAATLLLFSPAAILLGAVGPVAVEATQQTYGGGAGMAGGRVLGLSTLGSLVGTFGATHALLPGVGVRVTFLLAGLALFAAGLLLAWNGRQGRAAVAAALLVGALGVTLDYDPPGAGEGEVELAASDSAYQRVRVIERGAGEELTRYLRVNESLDSYQSIWTPQPGLLGAGYYYDHFALPLAFTDPSNPPARYSVLVIGLGAGTAVRVLEGVAPRATELDIVGFELDPEVVRLGALYFELREGPGRAYYDGLDGRAGLAQLERRFDQIVLDAYTNNMEIPPHLATVEFFRALRGALAPGGWLTANIGGFGPEDPVVAAMARTAAEGLGTSVVLVRVPFSRNMTLLARVGGEVPKPGDASWRFLPALDVLRGPLELPGAWTQVSPGVSGEHGASHTLGELLTDDRCPIEWLQLRSIQSASEAWKAGA